MSHLGLIRTLKSVRDKLIFLVSLDRSWNALTSGRYPVICIDNPHGSPPTCKAIVPHAVSGVAVRLASPRQILVKSDSSVITGKQRLSATAESITSFGMESFRINIKDRRRERMKVLICGSRGINDPALVARAVAESGMTPTHIVSGGARGVDTLARSYARSNGIKFTEYVADWDR